MNGLKKGGRKKSGLPSPKGKHTSKKAAAIEDNKKNAIERKIAKEAKMVFGL